MLFLKREVQTHNKFPQQTISCSEVLPAEGGCYLRRTEVIMSRVVLTHNHEEDLQGEQLRYAVHPSHSSAAFINMINHQTFTWW